jgi:RimJ/RimL family protein N-acetyltransferase
MFKFDGKQVSIREFTEKEMGTDSYYEWLRDYSVVRNIYRMEYLKPLSRDMIHDYLKKVLSSPDDSMFAIYTLAEDKFIGTLKIGHIDWRSGVCDLGIMIGDPESRGKGYSKEAVILGCDYAFRVLSLRKITGGAYSDNVPMLKTFLNSGFVEEGRKRKELLVEGQYLDHILFGLFKEEFYSHNKFVQ